MTIYRKDHIEPILVEGSEPRLEQRIGEAGKLTDLGVNIVTLSPGQRSSDRHWHARSDEFMLVLSGVATVHENHGSHDLAPGDYACWPLGEANAHTVENCTGEPLTFLVAGTNPPTDIVHYPDSGRTLFHEPPDWWITDREGREIRRGKT
ncbi:MAG: cupin domain-containing protein [Hyphomicrobiaceae bacterium]|nr:cupin domain-containing protein [Hyphomicrobiaceae bacterium]MCC0023703.1 cupin domain-containing protein [Hyphomicrobiaceae bacterium]